MFVAVLPAALIGTGFWLADVAGVSTAAGLLWVAFGAMLLVTGLFLAGWRQLKRQRVGLQRTGKELRANLAAMRQVLSSYAGCAAED
jgi:sulfite exporter TauE/SafE